MRVLDGEIVEPELALDAAQELLARLVEADPHERVVRLERVVDLVQREAPDPPAGLVHRAIDHALVHAALLLAVRPGIIARVRATRTLPRATRTSPRAARPPPR